ncbi:flagellar protein FlaG [Brevundimonas sp.]|jgi:flagellar protein FlaG|uniref:flagellar protein FlaG n=1 Tax=Brevundimonas sp. TaxID=1871086 RepID=UPI0037BFA3B0
MDTGRYRLSIEAIGANRFVYKVLDRVTGEVIRQLPREDVAKLTSDPTYRGGKLIDTVV